MVCHQVIGKVQEYENYGSCSPLAKITTIESPPFDSEDDAKNHQYRFYEHVLAGKYTKTFAHEMLKGLQDDRKVPTKEESGKRQNN